jgi:hypothetical protein
MSEENQLDLLLQALTLGGGHEFVAMLANHIADNLESMSREDNVNISNVLLNQLCYRDAKGNAKSAPMINMCLITLSNLTISEDHSRYFLEANVDDISDGCVAKSNFENIIKTFLEYDSQRNESGLSNDFDFDDEEQVITLDPWAHTSSILCNLMRIDIGRKYFLRRSLNYISLLCRQFRSKNIVRRRGSVATMRTCLFDSAFHFYIFHETPTVDSICYPLVVHTPFPDKEKEGMNPILWMAAADERTKHEPEVDILTMLLECIILLGQKRPSREILRKHKVYPIVRNLDLIQENEDVSNLILDIVNLLMRDEDEGPDNKKDFEDSDKQGILDATDTSHEKMVQATATSAVSNISSGDDELGLD